MSKTGRFSDWDDALTWQSEVFLTAKQIPAIFIQKWAFAAEFSYWVSSVPGSKKTNVKFHTFGRAEISVISSAQ